MRGRTAIALGAVLAGTLLTGIGTTSAVFSDTAAERVEVGAGQLALTVTPHSSPLRVTSAASNPATVTVTATGGGSVQLLLSALDAPNSGSSDCADMPDIKAVVGGASQGAAVRVPWCELVQGPQPIATLPTGAQPTQVALRVTGVGAAQTKGATAAWGGTLRFTVQQPGGFSDHQDVAASVTKPGKGNR